MAAYSSRDVIEGFLRYTLLEVGVAWRFPAQDSSPLPWRPEEQAQQAPPRLLAALLTASRELQRRLPGNLQDQMVALLRQEGGAARRGPALIRDELFRDGVNWGRIVVLMALGGALSVQAVQSGAWDRVEEIADWMEESLESETLRGWIHGNGGWDAFVELYQTRTPARFWTLGTVFGLVLLGAAFITLGVLLAQR